MVSTAKQSFPKTSARFFIIAVISVVVIRWGGRPCVHGLNSCDNRAHFFFHQTPFIFTRVNGVSGPMLFLIQVEVDLQPAIALFGVNMEVRKHGSTQAPRETDLSLAGAFFAITQALQDITGMIGQGPGNVAFHSVSMVPQGRGFDKKPDLCYSARVRHRDTKTL